MTIAGSQRTSGSAGVCGSAWSAADAAPSSARCIASRRASTIDGSLSRARCRRTRRGRGLSGQDLLLKPDRIYDDFDEMARRERRLKDGIDAVAIVTPNHAHAAAARAFLKAGIHVICDKPLTTTRREADQLAKLARESGLDLRRHAQLHGLSSGPAGARHGAGRRSRRDPRRAGRVCAGLARRRARETAATSRPSGAPTRPARARRDRSAISARMPSISPNSSPATRSPSLSADLHTFVAGPAPRRQRPHDAALCLRRQGHALVQPGRAGHGERPAHPRLRREGRARMACRKIRTSSPSRPSASRRG